MIGTWPKNSLGIGLLLLAVVGSASSVEQSELAQLAQDWQWGQQSHSLAQRTERQDQVIDRLIRNTTGIALNADDLTRPPAQRNLLTELQQLLLPLIDGLERISKRPRKIEMYRRSIDQLSEKIEAIERGVQKLQTMILKSGALWDAPTQEMFQVARQRLQERLRELQFQRSDLQSSLAYELRNDKSMMESMTEILREFFGQRGKNLVIGLGCFILVWLLMQRSRRIQVRFAFGNPLIQRPLQLLYNPLVFTCSFLAMLATFYLMNDWVLMTFFALILLSMIWSLKQIGPQFLVEAKFLVGLGTVREGERILWQGVPYRVAELGLITHLENPDLETRSIHIALKDLLGIYSYPDHDAGPLLPFKKGDWVELTGGLYGQIVRITHEQIFLARLDQGVQSFTFANFMALNPVVYTAGYTISFTIGLDYCHQTAMAAQEIQQQWLAELQQPNVSIQFYNFGINALELLVTKTIAPELAGRRFQLERQLKLELLTICAQKGWKIAYPQMQLHLVPNDAPSEMELPVHCAPERRK